MGKNKNRASSNKTENKKAMEIKKQHKKLLNRVIKKMRKDTNY